MQPDNHPITMGSPQESADESFDIAKYLAVIYGRKWSILALTLLGTILGALIVYSKTPLFSSTCQLVIENQTPKLPTVEAVLGIEENGQREYMQTQLQIIRSREIAEKVAEKLKLFNPDDQIGDVSEIIAEASQSGLESWLKSTFPVYDKQHLIVKKDLEIRRAEVANSLLGGLSVYPVGQTKIINITYTSTDPNLAAKVANTFAQIYINSRMSSKMEMTREGSKWLFDRMNVLKQNLEKAEKRLRDYIQQKSLVTIGGDVGQLAESKVASATVALNAARAAFEKVSRKYGPKHPKYIAALYEVNSAARSLREGKAEIRAVTSKESQLRELRSQVASDRALYENFLSRVKQTDESLGLNKADARILSKALLPTYPIAPNVQNFITMSAMGSFMLALLLVFLNESMKQTIRGPSDVEEKLGQVNLGLLPLVEGLQKKGRQRFPILDEENTALAESVRTIRTGIVLSGLDNPHKIVLVTSSIPGEGKTTVATNLGAALAQMEKILLIGADLRRPSLNEACGIDKHAAGLSELVAGNIDFKDAIVVDEETGLNILPSGMVPPNPLEILFSERFARMLQTLEKYYDRIVIDSPPVNAVSDALALARFAKTVVYVVEADGTPEKVVKHGLKRLAQHDAPLAGIVLNKVNVNRSGEYHGYYDQYGYSSDEKG